MQDEYDENRVLQPRKIKYEEASISGSYLTLGRIKEAITTGETDNSLEEIMTTSNNK